MTEVKVTKKAQTIVVYHTMVAAGAKRKEILSVLQNQVGLSVKGASTYLHNVKSGKWAA